MSNKPFQSQSIHVGTFVTEGGRPLSPKQAKQSERLVELRRKAEAGDAEAQNDLGTFYTGEYAGVRPDPAAALKWLGKAAEQGNALAIGNLGYGHLLGRVGPVDLGKGVELLEKAVAAGDVQSLCHLAYAHCQGLGVPKDEAKGAALYRRAVERGHAHAMAVLADMLRNGTGVAHDDAEALALARKGAALGNALSMRLLGDFYLEGRGGVMQDAVTAAGWYRNAAELGEASSEEQLGRMLESGTGLPRNIEKAASWYESAAAKGHAGAARRLAELRLEGSGVPKHVQKAVDEFRRAAGLGDAKAMLALGNLAMAGHGGMAYNPAKAVEWYRKAAEAGDAMAMFLLGEAYENWEGVEEKAGEAGVWFRKAAERGHRGAARALKSAHPPLLPVDVRGMAPQDRARWFSARNGDPDNMVWAADMFLFGARGFPHSEAEGLRWCELAVAAGSRAATMSLASFHASGGCLPKNLKKAAELFLPMAEQGDLVAMERLINVYRDPVAPFRRPLVEAARWDERLLEKRPEDAELMNNLGNLYFSLAKGGPWSRNRDPKGPLLSLRVMRLVIWHVCLTRLRLSTWEADHYRKAMHWYRNAADRKYAQAFTNLGDMSFLGVGGATRDEAEAYRLYHRASEMGDWHGRVNLGVMLCEGWGCEKDVAKGVAALRRAEEAGSYMARFVRELFYDQGGSEDASLNADTLARGKRAKAEFIYPPVIRVMKRSEVKLVHALLWVAGFVLFVIWTGWLIWKGVMALLA